ncbi:MAG: hypothetical protein VX589_17960, partial [Myxococcota bacterium]|nr:hypothetical protein [Myxococcota bacterium]
GHIGRRPAFYRPSLVPHGTLYRADGICCTPKPTEDCAKGSIDVEMNGGEMIYLNRGASYGRSPKNRIQTTKLKYWHTGETILNEASPSFFCLK